MNNNAHQFEGQKVKGQGHQTDYCWDRKCIISTERESIGTPMEHCAINCHCCEIGFLNAGGGIPCRPHPAATQLVLCQKTWLL